MKMKTKAAPYYYFESEHSFDIAKWHPDCDKAKVIMLRASIWWKWDDIEHSGELTYEEAKEIAKAEVQRLNAEYRKKRGND